ncbi:alanine--tRNA ligase [Pseudoclavibacter endophyticus]|uniref:Alanine--tRNA ligase n=1 Tax=Pseudoclavibacter endophyticus TaxID=1778590 RepID=A0A6H9WTR7_9MICO|nr:alanine--tRNA ligase [Pseudoclavibacter endophyticus]KAB1650075.1 alanine--tRNA ligase [Pseudoclavibacter endophyticus]GGA57485.1 alanine--tRNA ligase [Pseudoclavibacter endophyticus]
MKTAEIRQRFLDYFERNGHTPVPSASLVSDDPTIMFTIAGMVPFIPYLTGVVPAPYPRATSVQKCIRTNDIEEVGKTPRHGTFFQMCGNFSFGDYFKREAIAFAWGLLTTPEADGGLGFDPNDLWVTVYLDDDEAHDIWRSISGLPEERIQRLGMGENFWSAGGAGSPAGPCSEIFFDRGPEHGADGGPATDDDRYVEIWNLVFMQYVRGEGTSKDDYEIIGDLPTKNIDTGMGLERIAFIKQGVGNMYEIDQVRPVLDAAAELAGVSYGRTHEDDVRLRIIADHVRSSLMLMSDGVQPGNEGRGYILRRLLRRVVRSMRLLGVEGATFPVLFAASRDAMRDAYPEVATDFDRIGRLAFAEEQTFLRTLSQGTAILDDAVARTRHEGVSTLPGNTAFLLHDTFGFPIDLTVEMAEEAGLQVNRSAFDELMAEQRARAKADAKSKRTALADLGVYSKFRALGETGFVGYTDLEHEAEVLGILRDGHPVAEAVSGEQVELILDSTSLYAESGGQESDSGTIVGHAGDFAAEIVDVQRPVPGLVSHTVTVTSGHVAVGDRVETIVDAAYRRGANQAHSATHLVHAALRDVLGPDALQSGSYNRAGYLRLDFSWSQPLSGQTRSELEEIANNAIRQDYEVVTRELPIDEAKALGAKALFGEKYGAIVRMVDIGGPWSRELCGGTHVAHSSEIGLINLIGEGSVGAANRRVESLVGREAFKEFAAERAIVQTLASNLKTPRVELESRVMSLVNDLKRAEKRIADLEAAALLTRAPSLVSSARSVGAVRLVAAELGDVRGGDDVRKLAIDVRERLGSAPAVVALGAVSNGKPVVLVATNAAAREAGVKAGALVRVAAPVLGGGGGGKDDLAQGGGQDPTKLRDALAAVERELAGN